MPHFFFFFFFFKFPEVVLDSPQGRLWHLQDTKFKTPRGNSLSQRTPAYLAECFSRSLHEVVAVPVNRAVLSGNRLKGLAWLTALPLI